MSSFLCTAMNAMTFRHTSHNLTSRKHTAFSSGVFSYFFIALKATMSSCPCTGHRTLVTTCIQALQLHLCYVSCSHATCSVLQACIGGVLTHLQAHLPLGLQLSAALPVLLQDLLAPRTVSW